MKCDIGAAFQELPYLGRFVSGQAVENDVVLLRLAGDRLAVHLASLRVQRSVL